MNSKLAAAFFAASLAAAAAPDLEAAWYYEATTTTEGAGGGSASNVRAWVDGANARIEMTSGGQSGFLEAGTYLLTLNGGETLYVVDPSERTISEIDFAQIFQMAGNMAELTGGMVDMEFKDFTSEQLSKEPGRDVLGFPTTRYRFRTGYTMSIGMFGMTRENRSDTEHELLCTDAIDAQGFTVWLRPDRFRTGNEDMDRLIEQQFDFDCVPLWNRAVSTVAGGFGGDSTMTTTTEVTTLREEDAPAGTFDLPADYENVPFMPDMPEAGDFELPPQDDGGRRPRLRDLIGR